MKITKLLLLLLCTSTFCFAQDIKIYVSDAAGFNVGPWFIFQYDEDGSNPVTFIDEELSWPQDILFLPDRNEVIVSNLNTNRITRYRGSDGLYLNDFAVVPGGPTRMKLGDDGFIYVVQWSTTDNKIIRFMQDGTPMGEYTSAGVPRSVGIDWDSAGNLYAGSYGGGFVQQFDDMGVDQGQYVNTELVGPTNIWFDTADHLFVCDWSDGDVKEFDDQGNYVGPFIPDLSNPEGVAFRDNGNILIGNGGTSEVKEFLADGTFVGNVVSEGSGGLTFPNAVILFDRTTLSVPENSISSIFVTPTVGEEFRINPEISNEFSTIRLFDISGRLIETIKTEKILIDGTALNEGIYFLIAESKGQKFTQKIVVKKK